MNRQNEIPFTHPVSPIGHYFPWLWVRPGSRICVAMWPAEGHSSRFITVKKPGKPRKPMCFPCLYADMRTSMGSELRVLAAALLACSMLPFLFVYFWPLNGWRVIRLFAIRTWDFQHHWPRVTVIFFLRSLPSIADYRNCLPRLGLRAFLPSVKSWMAEGNAKQPALSSERVKETWP